MSEGYFSRGRYLRLHVTSKSPEVKAEADQVLNEWAGQILGWPNDSDISRCLMEDGSWADVPIGQIKADLRSLGA